MPKPAPTGMGAGAHGDRLAPPVRAAWLRPKQTDLVPGKGAVPLAFPPIRSATVVRQRFFGIPATDTDIISAQHFWTGGLETGWARLL